MAGRQLPLRPLLVLLDFPTDDPPVAALATLLGVSERSVFRYIHEGVSTKMADRICAKAANVHPITVWGNAFVDDIDTDALPDDPDVLFDPKATFA